MTSRSLAAVVLAAGHGTRMRSDRPKPLHVLVGKPMVVWVLDALGQCAVDQVAVVVGHGSERVTKRLLDDAGDRPLSFVEQVTQRGTGDAAAVGLGGLGADPEDDGDVLVLTADTPLLRAATLARLVAEHRASDAAATVLTARFADPTGYGRIVRGRDGHVVGIVEQADASPEEAAIDEINTGIFCFRRSLLAPALRRIVPDNAQGEYYLTDVVGVLADAGHRVGSVVADDPDETHGINDRAQLAAAESELRGRINREWMHAGVTFVDPVATSVDATVELERDVTLYPGVVLQGRCTIGSGAEIGPGSHLVDTVVGPEAVVRTTFAERASIGARAVVGPWAALGPGDDVPAGHVTGPHYAGSATVPPDRSA